MVEQSYYPVDHTVGNKNVIGDVSAPNEVKTVPGSTGEQVAEIIKGLSKNPPIQDQGKKHNDLADVVKTGNMQHVVDEKGNEIWDDGNGYRMVKNTDGTGYVKTADGKEKHWGPKYEDNYTTTPGPEKGEHTKTYERDGYTVTEGKDKYGRDYIKFPPGSGQSEAGQTWTRCGSGWSVQYPDGQTGWKGDTPENPGFAYRPHQEAKSPLESHIGEMHGETAKNFDEPWYLTNKEKIKSVLKPIAEAVIPSLPMIELIGSHQKS